MAENCVIILIEDDANDAFFVKRALDRLGFEGRLEHFEEVAAAKDYLQRIDWNSGNPATLVIADSATTFRDSGINLLEWMRQRPALIEIPFVILSGDVSGCNRKRAEKSGACLVLLKTRNFAETSEQLRQVVSQLPPRCREWLK